MKTPPRILVAESHELLCTALACLLERQGCLVVGRTSNGAEVVGLWNQLHPDILMLDLQLSGTDGLATIEAIRAIDGNAQIIALSSFEGDKHVTRAFRAGARGYLLKQASADTLLTCLHTVQAGEPFIPSALVLRLAIGRTAPTPTQREFEVLTGVAKGLCNKRIGQALGIEEGTVKAHLKSILRKLDADSRTEAASIAIRTGMVQL
jgi:DNA-binding NarL/FixJ family response regulator